MQSLTSRVTQQIFKTIAAFTVIVGLANCALFDNKKDMVRSGPQERVYTSPYDQVWRATQIVLSTYPITLNNMDKGLVETDVIKGFNVWAPPHKAKKKSAGTRYKLRALVVKGIKRGAPATKVTIEKDISLQRDFFSDKELLPSDGLEEMTLLYRIGRELSIDRALKKAQQRANN